jgi:hypothetical protein
LGVKVPPRHERRLYENANAKINVQFSP